MGAGLAGFFPLGKAGKGWDNGVSTLFYFFHLCYDIFIMTQKTIPHHLGFILDGNRRWAKERGLPAFFGHKKGIENVKKIVFYAQKLGVKIVTAYGFSTENWNRSKKEIDYLMRLFEGFLDKHLQEFHQRGIKVRHLGSLKKLPASLAKKIREAMTLTKSNQRMIFNAALNYGGRDEIKRTVQKLIKKGYSARRITSDLINKNLDTAGLPDPDLIIRTSGEQRLSGFLLWQAAYSELYFAQVHWPDFDEKEMDKAIEEYSKRQRRFGA